MKRVTRLLQELTAGPGARRPGSPLANSGGDVSASRCSHRRRGHRAIPTPSFTAVPSATRPFLKLPRHSWGQLPPLPNTLKASSELVSLKNDSLSPTSTLKFTCYLNGQGYKKKCLGGKVSSSV